MPLHKIQHFDGSVCAYYSSKPHFKNENPKEISDLVKQEFNKVPQKLVFQKQTHSATIHIVSDDYVLPYENTDALITNQKEMMLLVYTADCAPILVYNPDKKVVAAVHSGWKGTAQNIIGKTLQKMKTTYNVDHKNTQVYIGPCISQSNYEVGNSVFEALQKLQLNLNTVFIARETPGKYLCDIKEANKQLVLNEGVNSNNILISQQCTFADKKEFFSARGEGIETGRIISGIMLC